MQRNARDVSRSVAARLSIRDLDILNGLLGHGALGVSAVGILLCSIVVAVWGYFDAIHFIPQALWPLRTVAMIGLLACLSVFAGSVEYWRTH